MKYINVYTSSPFQFSKTLFEANLHCLFFTVVFNGRKWLFRVANLSSKHFNLNTGADVVFAAIGKPGGC